MPYFHAVFKDETGVGEFGAGVEAHNKEEARRILKENYPESRIVQLESLEEAQEREAAMYIRLQDEENGVFFDYEYEKEC